MTPPNEPVCDSSDDTPHTPYKTTSYLTKFELSRVVGLRVLQLSSCGGLNDDPYRIALREILESQSAATIRRKLPDGNTEDRRVRDLKLNNELRLICESQMAGRSASRAASRPTPGRTMTVV